MRRPLRFRLAVPVLPFVLAASLAQAGSLPPPVLLADIEPGDLAPPSDLALGGDAIYFSGPGPTRWQTWSLRNGQPTPLGTPCPDGGAALGSYVNFPGTLVGFISEHCFFSGTFLGTVDRVSGSAQPVVDDTGPSVGYLTRFGDRALFGNSASQVWVTDGTQEGTSLVRAFEHGAYAITSAGDWAVFGADGHTWRSDGTAGGTLELANDVGPEVLLPPWPSIGFPPTFVPVAQRVLFYARSPGEGLELWSTDGTSKQTIRLTNFRPGVGIVSVGAMHRCGQVVYFGSDGITPAGEGYESHLWRSDGTISGTYPIGEWTVTGWRGIDASPVGCLGSSVVLLAEDSAGEIADLAILDPESTRPARLLEVGPNADIGYPAYEYDGWLFFSIGFADEGYDQELWATDGTPTGTFQTGEISPGEGDAFPHSYIGLGDSVYFLARDPVHDQEIWRIVVDPALLFRDGFEVATLTAWNQPLDAK